MIYIIGNNYPPVDRYFAVNTINCTGGIHWHYTPEDALSSLTSNTSNTMSNHRVAKVLANGDKLYPLQYIHSSYSPDEYPELFI